jgi:hypothetical protein
MNEVATSPFAAWESFYVIVGSSAGALTGLQFVVMALVAEAETVSGTREVDAFGTPTVVHFCAVLLLSAVLSAPWDSVRHAGLTLALAGVAGLIYTAIVVRRARRQMAYKPVFEDWLWHVVLPFTAYAILGGAALKLPLYPAPSLFGIATTALLLLFIGIHNAWDTVTFVALTNKREPDQERRP